MLLYFGNLAFVNHISRVERTGVAIRAEHRPEPIVFEHRMVYDVALLADVLPVTRGRRYALTTFFRAKA